MSGNKKIDYKVFKLINFHSINSPFYQQSYQ